MDNKVAIMLMASNRMDNNQKPDREEDMLIRLSASARKRITFGTIDVDITGDSGTQNVKMHQAYKDDIQMLKGKVSPADMNKVGFVTTSMFTKLTGIKKPVPGTLANCSVSVKSTEKEFKLLIGADPEFLLFSNDNEVVHANNVMPKAGLIGNDGAMIEIRPKPSEKPTVLVQNMYNIFADKKLTSAIEDYKWMASAYHRNNVRDYPVGGHIHIGNPEGIDKLEPDRRRFLWAVINKILDELLGIPLIKLDGKTLGENRRSKCNMAMGKAGFGFYGEYRVDIGRLEYRTLSGLWLLHPEVATAVVGTAQAIAEEIYRRVKDENFRVTFFKCQGVDYDDHRDLYDINFDSWNKIKIARELGCVKSSNDMAKILNASDTSFVTEAYLKRWHEDLTKLSTYKKYAVHIDRLRQILSLPKKTITEVGFDIKENWLNGREFPS